MSSGWTFSVHLLHLTAAVQKKKCGGPWGAGEGVGESGMRVQRRMCQQQQRSEFHLLGHE